MSKDELEASLSMLDLFIQIFAVVVAIGIVGEVGFGVRHWILNRQLQRVQHSEDQARQAEIALLNKEAGNARSDAGKAIERAGKAVAAAEQLRKENLELQAKVLTLQDKFAWRTLTTAQRERIVAVLVGFRGQPFDISKGLSDPESTSFSDEIRAALVEAGWIPRDLGGNVAGPLFSGVQVLVHRDSTNLPAAVALIDLFKSKEFDIKGLTSGYEAERGMLAPVDPGHVAIHVGRKPQ